MRIRTKMICTIGPAVASLEKILELMAAGMNVARINFSHGSHQEHGKTIALLKEARERMQQPLAIMLDTKGPEIRVGEIEGGALSLNAGDKILLVKKRASGSSMQIVIDPPLALDYLSEGSAVLFDDGYLFSRVLNRSEEGVWVEVENKGVLKSRKGVNLPGTDIPLPAMTEQDRADITFGCEQDVDMIAASFIRSAEHVQEIKDLLLEKGKPETLVLAKIENSIGVKNFESIVQIADGVMVARGDLGVELPLNQVPCLQKMMITTCYRASKPVVTATQMLDSMIHHPRPTRAEVSDVANAIYDSTSAVMLSGETAVGSYPIQSAAMMRSIIQETEKAFNYRQFFNEESKTDYNDVLHSLALASVRTAYSAHAKALFVMTSSGGTARLISRFRPEVLIIALTFSLKVYHQLAFHWGVIPLYSAECKNMGDALRIMKAFAIEKGYVHYGDLVVITSGSHFGIEGTTNTMIVESIGEVLVRGAPGYGKKVEGEVVLVLDPEKEQLEGIENPILVMMKIEEKALPLLSKAKGLVLQSHPRDTRAEREAKALAEEHSLSLVVRADGAFNTLKKGQRITLDPQKGLIYQ